VNVSERLPWLPSDEWMDVLCKIRLSEDPPDLDVPAACMPVGMPIRPIPSPHSSRSRSKRIFSALSSFFSLRLSFLSNIFCVL